MDYKDSNNLKFWHENFKSLIAIGFLHILFSNGFSEHDFDSLSLSKIKKILKTDT